MSGEAISDEGLDRAGYSMEFHGAEEQVEVEDKPRFPREWPTECPPSEAVAAKGIVYRTCKGSPLSQDDFKSYLEHGKAPNACPCLRAGLSVFRDRHDAIHHANQFRRMAGLVSAGELRPEHGNTKPTPSKTGPSHTTWWPVEGLDRASIFRIVTKSSQ